MSVPPPRVWGDIRCQFPCKSMISPKGGGGVTFIGTINPHNQALSITPALRALGL